MNAILKDGLYHWTIVFPLVLAFALALVFALALALEFGRLSNFFWESESDCNVEE